jgi:hypothetical protein
MGISSPQKLHRDERYWSQWAKSDATNHAVACPVDGYWESTHSASPTIAVHVPVSLFQVEIRGFRACAIGDQKMKLKGVSSKAQGLHKAFWRPFGSLMKVKERAIPSHCPTVLQNVFGMQIFMI